MSFSALSLENFGFFQLTSFIYRQLNFMSAYVLIQKKFMQWVRCYFLCLGLSPYEKDVVLTVIDFFKNFTPGK